MGVCGKFFLNIGNMPYNIHQYLLAYLTTGKSKIGKCLVSYSRSLIKLDMNRKKIKLIESNAKCRYLKKLACKGI
jgi:hypothetical protein